MLSLWNPFISYIDLFDDRKELHSSSFKPAVSVYEDDASFYIDIALAGIDQKDIKVKVNDGVLSISGERVQRKEVKKDNYYANEISYGKFSRSFYLPDGATSDDIDASCKNGLLTITVRKSKKVLAKEISIKEA